VSAFDDLDQIRDEVESLHIDVLGAVLQEEAVPVLDELPTGPLAIAALAIHDEVDDSFAGVEVRLGVTLARVLASRMMFVADPTPDDVLDAVAELGNIVGGNVKSLLCTHARLSLPTAQVDAAVAPTDLSRGVHVRAMVLGHVTELSVFPGASPEGLLWPPTAVDEILEGHL
jgi:chemotaxis protein CheX